MLLLAHQFVGLPLLPLYATYASMGPLSADLRYGVTVEFLCVLSVYSFKYIPSPSLIILLSTPPPPPHTVELPLLVGGFDAALTAPVEASVVGLSSLPANDILL